MTRFQFFEKSLSSKSEVKIAGRLMKLDYVIFQIAQTGQFMLMVIEVSPIYSFFFDSCSVFYFFMRGFNGLAV